MNFRGSHVLSVDQFDRQDVEQVFDVARKMLPFSERRRVTRVLEGAVLGNIFFEPSTRTRISFGSAFNLLGGDVRDTTAEESLSLTKGENLRDTASVLSGYCDVLVMRHPRAGAVAEFSQESRVPVINGGDGSNEHPSQGLLDLFTLDQEMRAKGKTVDRMRIAVVGDLRYGRAVRSLCGLLSVFESLDIRLVSPSELRLPAPLATRLKSNGHKLQEFDELEPGIAASDAVYMTRIQSERFESSREADLYLGRLRLDRKTYEAVCEPDTIIMHPLPRDSRRKARELDEDLNPNPNLAIFRQTDNGLAVRMALFALILDVVGQFEQNSREVPWYRGRERASGDLTVLA